MSQYIEGIVANIGDDAKKLSNGECVVTAKYPGPISWKDDKDVTEVRTIFSDKDIHIYVPDGEGGVSKTQATGLQPQEYIFNAVITKLGPNLAKATNIVVTNVKK
jgi:hypothetical protein